MNPVTTAPVTHPIAEDGFDLYSVIIPLWRGKWFILLVTLLCAGFAIWKSYKKKPIYKAEAILTPVSDNSERDAAGFAAQLGGLASIVGVNLGGASSSVSNSLAIFRSKEFAKEFVRRKKLLPVFFDTSNVVDSQKDSLLLEAATALGGQMTLISKEGLLTLTVRWTDAKVAAQWANELVDFINTYLRTKSINEAEASIEFLKTEILKTPVASMQEMLNRLIEKQIQVIALAKVRKQYAFSVIDYATPPKHRESPNRIKDGLKGVAAGLALSVTLVFGLVMARNLRGRLAKP